MDIYFTMIIAAILGAILTVIILSTISTAIPAAILGVILTAVQNEPVATITVVVTALAVWTALRQFRSSGALEVYKFMQEERIRSARRSLHWTAADREQRPLDLEDARLVCSAMDMMGKLLQRRMAPKDVLLASYARTIVSCYEVTEAFMQDTRRETRDLWEGFDWLYKRAKRRLGEPMP